MGARAVNTDLRKEIGEAVTDSEWKTDDDADDDYSLLEEGAEGQETETPVAAADATPAEDGSGTVADPDDGEAEEAEAQEGTADEVPEEFWGVDLREFPPEKRAEIIAHFEQQESTIHKLQAQLATQVEDETPAPPAEEPEEVTDEDLMRVIGLDPEYTSPEDPSTAAALRLARNQLALEDQVERLSQARQAEEAGAAWNSQLDELEAQYGPIPLERNQVLKYAIDNGIASPFEAYFRITAPVQREVKGAVDEARRKALKQEASGGVRPRATDAAPKGITKDMPLKEAVALAAKESAKELKTSWRDVLQRQRTAKE